MMYRIAIPLLLLISACTTAPTPAPSTGVAPMAKVYTCAQTAQAAAEYKKLPRDSVLVIFLDDYGVERRALRAYHKQPLDGQCIK